MRKFEMLLKLIKVNKSLSNGNPLKLAADSTIWKSFHKYYKLRNSINMVN